MNEAAPTAVPATIERAVRSAKQMYPDAEIRVRRGRVIAIEDDLIRLITYRAGSPRTA